MARLRVIALCCVSFALGAFFMNASGPNVSRADSEAAKSSLLYELRTYTTNEGKLEDLHARFRDHTMRLFEKHGMKNIAYWTPTDPELKDNTLVYVIAHKSQEAADASWQAFGQDPEWQKVREASEKDGRILAKRPERLYLISTDYSPMKSAQ